MKETNKRKTGAYPNTFSWLTMKQIETILSPSAFKVFNKFMHGKTCGVNDKGELVVYPWDFELFLCRLLKK